MSYLILGITGKATAGKDTFYNLLTKQLPEYNLCRVSIGDTIRQNLSMLPIFSHVNLFNLPPNEKETIRPLMVEYARLVRLMHGSRFFLDEFDTRINYTLSKSKNNPNPDKPLIICVTDIRFDDYEGDEADWIQKKHKGKLIFIDRHNVVYGNKQYLPYVNDTEKGQIPKLRARADQIVDWPTTPSLNNLETYVNPIADRIRQNWFPV